ncbi:hypothetical protein NBRC116493_34100 [Aurantivibrio infirmus]
MAPIIAQRREVNKPAKLQKFSNLQDYLVIHFPGITTSKDMAIDPPSSTFPQPSKLLSSQRDAQLASLKVEAGIRIQGTVDALIKQVAPLTSHQRKIIFNTEGPNSNGRPNTEAKLFSNNPINNKSTNNNPINNDFISTDLKTLATTTKLYLAELELKNIRQLVITNKALKAGEFVSVKRAANNHLQIVDKAAHNNLTKELNKPRSSQNKDIELKDFFTQKQIGNIVGSLREALPKQSSSSQLIELAKTLNAQPKSVLDKLFNSQQKSILAELGRLARTPTELKNPQTLKQAINNSGVFLENKINQKVISSPLLNEKNLIPATRKNETSGFTSTNSLKSNNTLIKPFGLDPENNRGQNKSHIHSNRQPGVENNPLRKNVQPNQIDRVIKHKNIIHKNTQVNISVDVSRITTNNKHTHVEKLPSSPQSIPQQKNINEDIKGLSLLAKEIFSGLPITLDNATLKNHSQIISAANSSSLEKMLKPFLQNILNTDTLEKTNKENSGNRTDQTLQQQLLAQLRSNVSNTLARIQVLQAQSLMTKATGADTNLPNTPQIQIEIPVQYQNAVHQVGIDIEEDWLPEGGSPEEESKTKRWTVMLSFKLPNKGEFYAKLRVIEETVSVQFWADKTETLDLAKKDIAHLYNDLSAQGVKVEEIQCVTGKPPNTKTKLNYSLVDVRT